MTGTKWFFPTTQGGEASGLNDPGIEFFRQSSSLARETLQNSGDAADPKSDKPVTVTFELLNLPLTQFPDAARLREVITQCRDYMLVPCKTEHQKDENGRAWFETALRLLAGPAVPVLRIRDENTTGLEGGEGDEDKAWFRLIKKQGSASMHGAGGGTFGIGQRAPFAFSRLRTVFYSTLTCDGQHAFIGKTILSSFREQGRVYRPIGFWGVHAGENEGTHAVRKAAAIPELFRRSTVGTDLYIMGFDPENWRERVMDTVIRHFFAAIHDGRLVVRLASGGPVQELNASSLHDVIEARWKEATTATGSRKLTRAALKDIRDTLGVTRHYMKALTVPVRGKPFVKSHPHLGELKLYVALDPEAPSRTVFMRKPRILVYERTQRLLDGYAAVFLCDDQKGNELLARLEDPAHSKWERERLPGGGVRGAPRGDQLISDIYEFVRESLEELATKDTEGPQDLPDLGRYLPEDDAIQPGSVQTGKRVRTQRTIEEETARPQQAQGRKRAVQRPRPIRHTQVVLLPVESDLEGEPEGQEPKRGNEPIGTSGAGSGPDTNSPAAGGTGDVETPTGGEGREGPGGPGPLPGGTRQGGHDGNRPGTHGGPGMVPGAGGPGSLGGQAASGHDTHPAPGVLPGAGGHGPQSGNEQIPLGADGATGIGSSSLRALSQSQLSFRAWFSHQDKATILVLRSTRRGRINLRLLASGEDSDYKLEVSSAVDVLTGEQFTCAGDSILNLTFGTGQRREMKLELRPARRVALSIEVDHGA